ncbi:type I restriction enzyme M protein [Bradyrhizobium sp. AZCC 1610]|uniref:N-6 DNA methylase n=1 Tax=Bradyrhizobium sp. AZCC 1610 TaxID=3117020 RepID=UPI002FF37664
MLDTDTKRRIDTARDILVGKVPDPKSQVEQITIALIYKFMDDMDAEAEELGGKRKFFTGDFARFGWAQLMRTGIGGHEMLGLYAEGISTMPENPGIPLLFRDIFKNAYLPYRDPETLKAFLKIIDEFTYDHSERLGDAFEYLLSVLGSQGDAGQFRTPRHIIDFIVEILDPKKNESVLDPACGTAGFLISAYKHILKANSSPTAVSSKAIDENDKAALDSSRIPPSRGDLLTPEERGALASNFKGYDISPDMVRLSLVNLYLHGFSDPHIYEYDTLTSEDRWNEFADIILANPPFMSPKGGIKPHRRFSIQAKRSEVLFVDYMAEHLTPCGRAGIIVPEGIIFQSQTAYTELRRMLVENSLVAVVSLPAGCFNPYSGVKTSILLLDKSLAKDAETIAFFKVENDGFGLGAQRRAIGGSELPQIRAELNAYLHALRNKQSTADLRLTCGLIVPKEKIVENGDYNLSGERYRELIDRETTFPKVKLGELLKLEFGTRITKKDYEGTLFPVYGGGGESFRTDSFTRENDIVISRFAMSAECVRAVAGKFYLLDSGFTFSISEKFIGLATKTFVAQVLLNSQDRIYRCARGHAQKNIDIDAFKALEIPLPPLALQNEIVAEIEGYQKVIGGARTVLDHYRPHIPIHPEWPMVGLGEVIESKPKNGYSGSPVDRPTNVKVLSLSATTSGKMDLSKFKYLDEDIPLESSCRCRRGDIYLQRGNTRELVGTAAIFDADEQNFIYPDLMIRVRADESKIRSSYLLTVLQSEPVREFIVRNAVGAAGSMPKINQGIVERIPVPLPPLATQEALVAEIEAEQALVAGNHELIIRFEQKVQSTLARIWGEQESVVTEA